MLTKMKSLLLCGLALLAASGSAHSDKKNGCNKWHFPWTKHSHCHQDPDPCSCPQKDNKDSVVLPTCPPSTLIFTNAPNGKFLTDTDQVLSFYYPSNSSATEIVSIDLYNPATTTHTQADVRKGLPSTFATGKPDTAASIDIHLQSLLNIQPGTYLYRVYVKQKCGHACIADSNTFEILPALVHQCNVNEERCTSNGLGFQKCTKGPLGNTWATLTRCGNAGCIQEGQYSARCATSSPSCSNANPKSISCHRDSEPNDCKCTLGEMKCFDGGFRQCVPKVKGGTTWSTTMACGPGTVCKPIGDQSIICDWPERPILQHSSPALPAVAKLDSPSSWEASSIPIDTVAPHAPETRATRQPDMFDHDEEDENCTGSQANKNCISKPPVQYFPPEPEQSDCTHGRMECYGTNQYRFCKEKIDNDGNKIGNQWSALQTCSNSRNCMSIGLNFYVMCA